MFGPPKETTFVIQDIKNAATYLQTLLHECEAGNINIGTAGAQLDIAANLSEMQHKLLVLCLALKVHPDIIYQQREAGRL